MRQEIGMMPAQCVDCGEYFDLKYDFDNYGKVNSKKELKELEEIEESEGRIVRLLKKVSRLGKKICLCWKCRG